MYIYVYTDICVHVYGVCMYVYLLSTYLEGYFMKIVTTGSVPCLLLLYRRFLNVIINFFGIEYLRKAYLRIFL